MTLAGWIFMIVSCVSITILTAYTYWKMLTKK